MSAASLEKINTSDLLPGDILHYFDARFELVVSVNRDQESVDLLVITDKCVVGKFSYYPQHILRSKRVLLLR